MAKVTKRFENLYAKRDPSSIKERANQRGGDFDSLYVPGTKLFKPREGKNLVRVLPPAWPDASHYGYEIWCNYGIGVDTATYLSLSKMKNEKDPIVEARKQAEREGNKELADKLAPRKRILFYVIDRNAEDEGPQLWSAPWTVDKDFCNLAFDEDTKEVVMIDHPEEGCDVRFYKEGTGLATKYDSSKMRILKPSILHEDEGVMNEWLEYIQNHPIPDILNFYSYDHIAGVFDGFVPKDEEKPKRGPVSIPSEKVLPNKSVLRDDDEDELIEDRKHLREVAARPAPKSVEHDEDGVVVEDVPAMSVSRIRERLQARKSKPVDDED